MKQKLIFFLVLCVSSPAAADSDPFQQRVEQADDALEQATVDLDRWSQRADDVREDLADCETSACRQKESNHLAYKEGKVAQSEEAVGDAAKAYLQAEEAYKDEHGEYRDSERVSLIQRAMASANNIEAEHAEYSGTGEHESSETLKDYEINEVKIGGAREYDPANHQSYTEETRDPGVVNIDDDDRMAEYASAASDVGQGDRIDLTIENRGGTVGGAGLNQNFAIPAGGIGAMKGRRGKPLAGDGGIRQGRLNAGLPRGFALETQNGRASGGAPFSERETGGSRSRRSKVRGYLRASQKNINGGDYFAAYDQARKAILADPENPAAWILKAKAVSGMGSQATGAQRARRFAEAERAAQEAIRLGGANGEAFRELASAQLHLGKNAEAIESATRAIEKDSSDAKAYALRAFGYEQLGQRDLMLADLKRAAALDPGRFEKTLRDALAGIRVFDPSASDNRRLLDAMTAIPHDPVNDKSSLVLMGLLLIGCSASGLLVAWVWRRLRTVDAPPTAATAAAQPQAQLVQDKSKLLAGKYELRRTIGRGAWGQVWEAYDCSLGRLAAIKQIEAAKPGAEGDLPQFHLREARTLASLEHPNIVDIYEVLELPQGVFLVFEMLEGKTVQQILAERKRLPPAEVRTILGAVASALSAAHEHRIVHRDLKPANLMVTNEGHVKVMDFGIAKMIGETGEERPIAPRPGETLQTSVTSQWVGTPGYRPPEAEQGVVSAAFDLYSLGVLTFEMLVGRRPFGVEGEATPEQATAALRAAVPGMPAEVEPMLARLLEPDYTRRTASLTEFMQLLNLLPATPVSNVRS